MEALARRGPDQHLVGFTVYGDYSKPNPPAEIVHAVAKGDVDIAIVWVRCGLLRDARAGAVEAVAGHAPDRGAFPANGIRHLSGVRRQDTTFHCVLNEILVKRKRDIDHVLDEYGVPRIGPRVIAAGRERAVSRRRGAQPIMCWTEEKWRSASPRGAGNPAARSMGAASISACAVCSSHGR